MTDTLSRLQDIFRDVLGQPDLILTRESSGANVHGWNSLAHVNLLWTIEQEFKTRFALGEIEDLKNVGHLVDLLEQKTGAGA